MGLACGCPILVVQMGLVVKLKRISDALLYQPLCFWRSCTEGMKMHEYILLQTDIGSLCTGINTGFSLFSCRLSYQRQN